MRQRLGRPAGRHVPDSDGPVVAAGDKRFAAVDECEGPDTARVGIRSRQAVFGCEDVPEVQGLSSSVAASVFPSGENAIGPSAQRHEPLQNTPRCDFKEHQASSAPVPSQDLSVR